MSISKQKSSLNRKSTLKAQEKDIVTENNAIFKEIEREMTAAQPVILSGKDKKYFKELCESVKNSLYPQNEVEHALVNQIACFQWKFDRLEILTKEVFEEYTGIDGRIRWGDLLKTNFLKKIVQYEHDINDSIIKLVYRFKERPVLVLPRQRKIRV